MAWIKRFYDPIILPDGRKLLTLRDAAEYITALPKAEHDAADWQVAMETLLLVAERDGPEMLARIAVMKALNRHRVRCALVRERAQSYAASRRNQFAVSSPPCRLSPKQRHKLLMADRTGDAAWITAAIEHLVAADPTVTLDEIEGALRDAAGSAYVVAGERFEVVIGMPAMLAAVATVGMTPLENRVALAGKPAVAGAAALLHQNVGGSAY